jgi:hypothetical protein
MEATERLGVKMIPVSHLTDQPLIQRIGRIAAAIAPRLNRYVMDVDAQVKHVARAMVDPARRNAFMTRATEGLERSAKNIVDFTTRAVKYKGMHPRQQGLTIQKMIQDWWKASGKSVDALYATARSLHDPDFDLSPVLKDADAILARYVTPGKPVTVGVGDAAEEVIPLVRFGRAPTGRLRNWIKRFKSIDEGLPDPDLPEGVPVPSKTDRIRAMIQELDDLGSPGTVGGREPDLLAKRLSAKLREVLDNPIGGDAEFQRTWKKPSKAARKRFKTRETLAVIDAVDSDTPSGIVNRLLLNENDPATIDKLIAMRQATSKEGWGIIRQEYKQQVLAKMRDPDALDRYLDNTQSNVKRMLMDPAEERVIRTQAGKIRKLYQSGIREAALRQSRNRSFVKQLIDTGDTAKIDALTDFVTAPGNGELYADFQHAIMDEIIERSMIRTKEGVERLSGRAMKKVMYDEKTGFAAKGLLDVLHPTQVAKLHDVNAIQRLLDGAVEDAGTSLTGAATAMGFFSGALSSLGRAVHILGLSRVLTSPGVAKFLVGTGKKDVGPVSTRRAAMLVGAVATHLMKGTGPRADDEEKFEQLTKVVSLVPPGRP